MKTLWLRLENLFFASVDPRPFALVRIFFSVVALLNLINLWPDRLVFFSAAGMIDGPALREAYPGPYISIFHEIDSPEFVTTSFVVAAVAMIFLGLGIGTRLAALVVWIFISSYIARGFPAMHGWDVLLRIIAFVLLISPADRCWSLASWLRGGESRPREDIPRYGLLLLQVQLAVIYWETVWLKIKDDAWRHGEFIAYFMRSMYSRFPDWPWEHWELLSNGLTYGTLIIEVAVPLLLWSRRYRWWGFVLGWGLHLGIWGMSSLWLFSLTIMIPYFAFLERADLDTLSRWLRLRKSD